MQAIQLTKISRINSVEEARRYLGGEVVLNSEDLSDSITSDEKSFINQALIKEIERLKLNYEDQSLFTPLIKYPKPLNDSRGDEKGKKRIVGEILFRTLVMLPVCALGGSMEFVLKSFLIVKNLIILNREIKKYKALLTTNYRVDNATTEMDEKEENILFDANTPQGSTSADSLSSLQIREIVELNSQIILRQEHIKNIKKGLLKSLLPFTEMVGMIIVCLLHKYGIIKIQKLFPSLDSNAKQMAVLLTFCFLAMLVLCTINNVIRRGESCCTSSLLRSSFIKEKDTGNTCYVPPNCLPLNVNSEKLELSTDSVTLQQLLLDHDGKVASDDVSQYIVYSLNVGEDDTHNGLVIHKDRAREVIGHHKAIEVILLPMHIIYGLIKIIVLPFLLAAIAFECTKDERGEKVAKEAEYTLKFIPETIKSAFGYQTCLV